MPFFSVIIPLYNKANFVKKTLQSLINQTYQNFEVIIVNDGSTDNSLDIVNSLKNDKFKILNQENQGVSIARNNGVNISQGQWISFLDADDIWYPEHLQELKNCVDRLPKAKLVSTTYKVRLQQEYLKTPAYSKEPSSVISYIYNYLEYSYIDPLFWTSSMAVVKDKFIDIGGFDEKLKTGEDLDFMIRFSQQYLIGYNPIHTITYNRITENNLTDALTLAEKKKYIDKHKAKEIENSVLKKYLDINRYSLALQAKMNSNKTLFQQTVSEINHYNLDKKKILLLKLPGSVLRLLKNVQLFFIKKGFYKSAFD